MAKRKKSSVFNDDDGTADGKHGFMEYVREKTEQSRKRAKEGSASIEIAQNEIRKEELSKDNEPETRGSSYMDQLIESKRRRELDRLHAQSVKTRLERKLEGSDNAEEIVTDGYRQKKESYDKAEELAQDEQNKELMESQDSIWGADGVALKMIATEEPQENRQQSVEYTKDSSKPKEVFSHFGNDVYVNESIQTRHLWDRQDDLDHTQTVESVKKFLKSGKTKQDVDDLVKQYWKRHNGIIN